MVGHLLIYRFISYWLMLDSANSYRMRSFAALGMFFTVSLKLRNYLLTIHSTSSRMLGYKLLPKIVITLLPNYSNTSLLLLRCYLK